MISLIKYLFFILIFCFLVLFQESFLNNFTFFNFFPSFYLIFLFYLIFFDKKNLGIVIAILAGLILDIFSFSSFGLFTCILGLDAFLIKKISLLFKKSNVIIFFFLFILFFIFYKLLLIFGDFILTLIW